MAALEGEMAQTIEEEAPTITDALSPKIHVSIEKTMSGQFQNLGDGQLPDTGVLASTARTQVQRLLSLHLEPSLYRTQSG